MSKRFRVLKMFTLLRTRDGAVIDDGSPETRSLPILGEYHPPQEYPVTPVNTQAVSLAVAGGLAEFV